jgi:uncharacterized protein
LTIETSLPAIANAEAVNELENRAFSNFLKKQAPELLDAEVQQLNTTITPQIDCTACGNCCKTLMINVTEAECTNVSKHLNQSVNAFKEQYIETSLQGAHIINTIPCHFLSDNKCTIYENRFTECRDFPHLDKPNFKERIFGTMMHYGRCPIIYNVVEALKETLSFKE